MLENIVYGNPNQSQLKWLEKKGLAFKYFEQLSKFSFPSNDSRVTISELNELVDAIKKVEDIETIKRYRLYDSNLSAVYKSHAKTLKITEAEGQEEKINNLISDIFEDVNYLIFNLKYIFQRPRPHQLAQEYKLTLFPFKSINADSPSYPSASVIQADLLSHVLGNWFPNYFSFFTDLSKDVENSRFYMGLNYESDLDFSMMICELIKNDKDFIMKYSL